MAGEPLAMRVTGVLANIGGAVGALVGGIAFVAGDDAAKELGLAIFLGCVGLFVGTWVVGLVYSFRWVLRIRCRQLKESTSHQLWIVGGDCSWLVKEQRLMAELLGRGVGIKLLCDHPADSTVKAIVQLRASGSLDVRTRTKGVPFKCILVDPLDDGSRFSAVLEASPSASKPPPRLWFLRLFDRSLRITHVEREAVLFECLREWFRSVYNKATPLPSVTTESGTRSLEDI